MNLKRIDLNLLTVFDAIMAERNMTRAAETIGLTQPAISLAVSRLRALIGDQLFERTGRGVRPTPRALAMAAPVRRALDTIVSAIEANEVFDPTISDRTFKLILNDYGELLYTPALIHRLEKARASVTIQTYPVTGMDVLNDLRFGAIDLLCWLEPIIDDEISFQQITSEGQACLVREDHPMADRELTIEDYVALKHLIIRMPVKNSQTVVDQRVRAQGYERTIAVEVHSCHEMPRIIAATDLICTLPVKMAQAMAANNPVKVVNTPLPDMDLPTYIMWHRSLDQDPGHTWLRNMIIDIGGSN